MQVRTAFNLLGPMLNPAHAAYGLVGVYSQDIAPLMAGALQRLGLQKALVVHSFGLDELTPLGPSDVIEVGFSSEIVAASHKDRTCKALQGFGLQKVLTRCASAVVHSFGLFLMTSRSADRSRGANTVTPQLCHLPAKTKPVIWLRSNESAWCRCRRRARAASA